MRPRTLHTIVLFLWVVVGAFTGLAVAATIGTVQRLDRGSVDLKLTEYLAGIGRDAGPFFVAVVVALGAIAVVEAILITLRHVSDVDDDPNRRSRVTEHEAAGEVIDR